MFRHLAIAILLVSLATGLSAADAPALSVDRDRVYEGNSVTLTLLAPGADENTTPDFSAVPDARVELRAVLPENRQSLSIINGKVTREGFSGIRYTYEVWPLKTGPFKGGPVRIRIKGQDHILKFPPLVVLEIPSQDTLRLDLEASPATVLPEEPFTVTLRLKVKRLPPPYSDIAPFLQDAPPHLFLSYLDGAPIEGLSMPDIRQQLQAWLTGGNSPGFAINEFRASRSPFGMGGMFGGMDPFAERAATFLPPGRVVEEGGTSYIEYAIAFTFTARDLGSYTFGPARLNGGIITGADEARRPLTLEVAAIAQEKTVRVVPPPAESRPGSYFGLIGSNLVVDAQLNASICRVGDPLKLTLQLRGPVNWRNATTPTASLISNLTSRFQIYGSTIQTDKKEDGRDITFTLRPLQPGTEEIPPIPFSWFDSPTRTYRTVRTAPIPLRIDPSAELTAAPWMDDKAPDGSGSADAASFAKAPAALRQGYPAYGDALPPAPFVLAAAGPLLFLARLLFLRRRRRDSERKRRHNRKNALSKSLHALEELRRLTGLDPRAAAGKTQILLRDFIGDWTGCKTEGLTLFELTGLLRDQGIPADRTAEFEDLMALLSRLSYSPDIQAEPLNNCLDSIPALLSKLFKADSDKPGAGVGGRRLTLLLLGCLTAGGWVPPVSGEEAGVDNFEWETAQALAFKAVTPADFKEAAIHYNRLVDDDVRNPNLFYNMGTCLLMAKLPEPALRSFLRTERHEGRPTDLVRNMDLARAALTSGETNLSWNRAILYVHYGLPLKLRLWAASLSFFLFWSAWTITLGGSPGRARLWMAAALFGVLLFATSVGVTLVQENEEEPLKLDQTEIPHAPN